jgi:CRISP-associated protein Cas1
MQDLHILPKLRDSLSYIYIEHALIQRYRESVEKVDERGRTALPIAALTVLLLGPGTRITHEAVKLLARNGCSIVWVGEDATRYYAQGMGETRKAYRLLHQAQLVSDPVQHRAVAIRMYTHRFEEPLASDLTIEQIRGHEGARVRSVYRIMSRRYGVKWQGRRYDRGSWERSDPINRALSAANALLNGICHAAIVSGGFSPGLGFIHTGKQLSFVYDVADLYKTEITIPTAFQTAALGSEDIEARVRQQMRQKLRETKLLERILPDLDTLLEVGEEQHDVLDEDSALPTPLWDDDDAADGYEDGEQWSL